MRNIMQGIMCRQKQANGLGEVMETKRLEVNLTRVGCVNGTGDRKGCSGWRRRRAE